MFLQCRATLAADLFTTFPADHNDRLCAGGDAATSIPKVDAAYADRQRNVADIGDCHDMLRSKKTPFGRRGGTPDDHTPPAGLVRRPA
jgi:hypothetical protein